MVVRRCRTTSRERLSSYRGGQVMMRWAACGIALAALAASGWGQAEGASPDKRRITTEQEYRDEVVGRVLIGEHASIVIHEDGRISGKARGKKLTGKWWWKGKYFCRTIEIGGKSRGRDCQTVFLEGDRLTGHRKKGKGTPFAVHIQER